LLYEQGFTINGARHRLEEATQTATVAPAAEVIPFVPPIVEVEATPFDWAGLRAELQEVADLLEVSA
jgi:hypothetical protein